MTTYPIGTRMVGGYQVNGITAAQAPGAVSRLAEAFIAAFPMGTIAPSETSGPNAHRPTKGWGPAFGVPSGRLYLVIRTNREGVTSDEAIAAFGTVASDLERRLGLTVHNTHAHTLDGAAPLRPPTVADLVPISLPIELGSASPMVVAGVVVGGIALVAVAVAVMRRRRVVSNRRNRRRRR